jgi:hypothetical protein
VQNNSRGLSSTRVSCQLTREINRMNLDLGIIRGNPSGHPVLDALPVIRDACLKASFMMGHGASKFNQ